MIQPAKVNQKYRLGQVVFYEEGSAILTAVVRNVRYDFREDLVYYTVVTSKDQVIEVREDLLYTISKYIRKGQQVVFYPNRDEEKHQGAFDSYNTTTGEVCIADKLSDTGFYYVQFRDLVSIGDVCYIQHE